MSTVSCPEYGELQERLHRLVTDRDSLNLQVSVLSEQVGAQEDKIKDLEVQLTHKATKLDTAEEMLQEEMINRTTLESSKLDLMTEIANLKVKFIDLEKDKLDTERRLRDAQNEILQVQKCMQLGLYSSNGSKNFAAQHHQPQNAEIEELRVAVQRLVTANSEKDQQIEQLRHAVEARTREPSLYKPYTERKDQDFDHQLRQMMLYENQSIPQSVSVPSGGFGSAIGATGGVNSSSSYTSNLSALTNNSAASQRGPLGYAGYQPPQLLPTNGSSNSRGASPAQNQQSSRQLALELDELRRVGAPVSSGNYSSTSLPRSLLNSTRKTNSTLALSSGVSRQSSSSTIQQQVPKLSAVSSGGVDIGAESDDETLRGSLFKNANFKRDKKQRSLRDIFAKLKRSGSSDLSARARRASSEANEKHRMGPFSRGVLQRATASARLPSSGANLVPLRPPYSLFAQYDVSQCCEWLHELGLSAYVADAHRYVRSGRHLLTMSDVELEKELGMKNPVHRKKLRLSLHAIKEANSIQNDACNRMDVHQVLRWLDDIGLPQYREVFADNLIDGPMLLVLNVDDLLNMRIINATHLATISTGIRFLVMSNYNMSKLQRKYNAELASIGNCPQEVLLWSLNCISEWLKTIDLAEFTPNLMCAGIHGALMVLEPSFTAETLCDLIQMPQTKTLLRRHLATHFNSLLGQDVIAQKRNALQEGAGMLSLREPLSPEMRIRTLKRGFSLPRKKAKTDVFIDGDTLVCPKQLIPTQHLQIPILAANGITPSISSCSIDNSTEKSETPTLSIPLSQLDDLQASNV